MEACIALTDVKLPSTLDTLPTSTFYGCTALETVSFPEAMNTIGSEAFYQCTALKDVTSPKSQPLKRMPLRAALL